MRRASDHATTERLRESPWAWDDDRQPAHGPRLTVYQRTVAALAVAVISIAAVAALALSRGAGLAGSLHQGRQQGEQAETALIASIPATSPDALPGVDAAATPTKPADLSAASGSGVAVLSGDVPADAKLQVDGRELQAALFDGAAIELSPGEHRVVITAAGFQPWTHDLRVEPAGQIALPVQLEALPAPPRASRSASRPTPPASLLGELGVRMRQGRVLHDLGRYLEAAEIFREVRASAAESAAKYSAAVALEALADDARQAIEDARRACQLEKQPFCP